MSSTTFSGPVTSTAGFVGDVTGNVTGTIISTRAVLASAGSGASTAAVIATQVVVVTGADGTKAVALPAAATTSAPILVINDSATATLPVYPISGGNDNINAGAEDAAFTVGAGRSAWFTATSATQWYVEDNAAALPTTTELNLIDAVTAGTAAASKFVLLDSTKSIAALGSVTSTAPTGGGIGYAVGAGGAVTQATNRSTGVTLNTLTGTITGNGTSLAGLAEAEFVVTNSTVGIRDVIILSIVSGPTANTSKVTISAVAAGSFTIKVRNAHATTADTGAPIINFAVFKAVNS